MNYDGSYHSAERVAFYWSNGTPYLEFQPIPKMNCTYLMRFVVGSSVDALSLSDPLSLGEVGDLLTEVRAATSLLQFAEWDDDEARNEKKRLGLGTTLDWEDKLLLQQYDADIQIHTGSNIGQLWMPD